MKSSFLHSISPPPAGKGQAGGILKKVAMNISELEIEVRINEALQDEGISEAVVPAETAKNIAKALFEFIKEKTI